MADKTLADRLSAMRACPESVQWARDYTDDAVAWRECQRGDWMLWLLGQIDVDRKRLVLATCGCARLSLYLAPDGEDRPRIAIETAEAWARGDGPTLDDVRRSAYDAYDAYAASYAAHAAYAASAAAAAHAASAAAHAAAASAASAYAHAASAAAHAASAYAHAASAASAASQCADIVRTHFPEVPHVQ